MYIDLRTKPTPDAKALLLAWASHFRKVSLKHVGNATFMREHDARR